MLAVNHQSAGVPARALPAPELDGQRGAVRRAGRTHAVVFAVVSMRIACYSIEIELIANAGDGIDPGHGPNVHQGAITPDPLLGQACNRLSASERLKSRDSPRVLVAPPAGFWRPWSRELMGGYWRSS